jgi:hypothetical protein
MNENVSIIDDRLSSKHSSTFRTKSKIINIPLHFGGACYSSCLRSSKQNFAHGRVIPGIIKVALPHLRVAKRKRMGIMSQ